MAAQSSAGSEVASLFASLATLLREDSDHEITSTGGRFAVIIPGAGNWLIDLESHPCVVERVDASAAQRYTGARVHYRDADTFVAIYHSRLRPEAAWASKRLRVEGDLASLPKLRRIFEMLRTRHAPSGASSAPAGGSRASLSARAGGLPLLSSGGTSGTSSLTPTSPRSQSITPGADRDDGSVYPHWHANTATCEVCAAPFTFTVRRHHCRLCGRCVCGACSRGRINGERCCNTCATSPRVTAHMFRAATAATASSTTTAARQAALSTASVSSGLDASLAGEQVGPRAPLAQGFAQQQRRAATGAAGAYPHHTHTSGEQASGPHSISLQEQVAAVEARVTSSVPTLTAFESAQARIHALQEAVAAAGTASIYSNTLWTYVCVVGAVVAALHANYGVHAAALCALLCAAVALVVPYAADTLVMRRLRAFHTTVVILWGLRRVRARTQRMSDEESTPIWDAENLVYARFAYENMLQLRGFWTKVAQYLSARADVMPPQYVEQLCKLQDATLPTAFAHVRALVERELGGPLEHIFSHFSAEPVASASIAQVHRATLQTPVVVPQLAAPIAATKHGSHPTPTTRLITHVAVKVQHPGIETIMRSDLWTLSTIVRLVAWLEPEYDFRPVMEEWAREAIKELDFVREASLTSHAERVLAATGCFARVPHVLTLDDLLGARTPHPTTSDSSGSSSSSTSSSVSGKGGGVQPLDVNRLWLLQQAVPLMPLPSRTQGASAQPSASSRVMIMEFIDGCKLSDRQAMEGGGVDSQAVMTDICEAFAIQMHVVGAFQADPHGGNFLLELPSSHPGLPRARPVILDFGLTKVLGDEMRLSFCRMVVAAASGDSGALLDSFDAMGVKLNRENPSQDLEMVQFMLRDTRPVAESRQVFKERSKVVMGRMEARKRLKQKKPYQSWPADLLFYLRSSELLHGLGASLHAHVEFKAIIAKYARAALTLYYGAQPQTPTLFPPISRLHGQLHKPLPGCDDVLMLSLAREAAVVDIATAVHYVDRPLALCRHSAPASTLGPIDAKVHHLLAELWSAKAITGCQVAVYQHGVPVVDAAFGDLGAYDPRPVRPNTLFPCFSVTKGPLAALFHIMYASAARLETSGVQQGQLYDALVTSLWPTFAAPATSQLPLHVDTVPGSSLTNGGPAPTTPLSSSTSTSTATSSGKAGTTVRHILAHMSGLQHAIPADIDMVKFCDLNAMITAMEQAQPMYTPGCHTSYQYYTFGWLVAGLLKHLVPAPASGVFSVGELLQAEIASKLGLISEMYIGIAPELSGDDARLAKLSGSLFESPASSASVPSSQPGGGGDGGPMQLLARLDSAVDAIEGALNDDSATPADKDLYGLLALIRSLREKLYLLDPRLFNRLAFRRAEIPAANGHFTARALAKFYAALGAPLATQDAHAETNGSSLPMLLPAAVLAYATRVHAVEQRRTSLYVQGQGETLFGLGFQLYPQAQQRTTATGAAGPVASAVTSKPSSRKSSVVNLTEDEAAVLAATNGAAAHAHPSGGITRMHADGRHSVVSASASNPHRQHAFGHSGFGGSLALFDPRTNCGVGITLNQLSAGKAATQAIMALLHAELGLVQLFSF